MERIVILVDYSVSFLHRMIGVKPAKIRHSFRIVLVAVSRCYQVVLNYKVNLNAQFVWKIIN